MQRTFRTCLRGCALALALALVACGGDDESPADAVNAPPSPMLPTERDSATDTLADATMDAASPSADVGSAGAGNGTAARDGDAAPGVETGPVRFAVQVGAFVNAASAQRLERRLTAEGVPVWHATATVGGRSYHRIRIGAASTAAEARQLRSVVQSRLGLPVWIAPLTPSERRQVPAGALAATRDFLGA